MNITQINTTDSRGGAAVIVHSLHLAFLRRGLSSYLLVGYRFTEDDRVISIPNNRYGSYVPQFLKKVKLTGIDRKITRLVNQIEKYGPQPLRLFDKLMGYEDFRFPASENILELAPHKTDILHLHNLHGEYFDLRQLPKLTNHVHTLITLHDQWTFTGHCAYSLDCEKWKVGCGQCPYLDIYPTVRRDGTARNWRRKAEIYRKSKFWVVAPSEWLLSQARSSTLARGARGFSLIRNGIDLDIFEPRDIGATREELGLPRHAWIVLFVGNTLKSAGYKDIKTMELAFESLVRKYPEKRLLFIYLGTKGQPRAIGENATIIFVPTVNERGIVARYYNAADVYVHAAKADTYPTTILEAMASGKSVVATNVGGINELVLEGHTGFLVAVGDSEGMANRIKTIFDQPELRQDLESRGVDEARANFGYRKMVDSYLSLYTDLLRHEQASE